MPGVVARAPMRQSTRFHGSLSSHGSPSAGIAILTGIATPSYWRLTPGIDCSSCHTISSRVLRFFPLPVVMRRTQVRVS